MHRVLLCFVYRLFADDDMPVSTSDCGKAQASPLRVGTTPVVSRTGESALGVLAAADGSIEHRRSSIDTSLGLGGLRSSGTVLSAERPQHSATSRPGREGIKLNTDGSRTISLLKKQDAVCPDFKPDVQGLTTSHSYVDEFSEFIGHGK